MSQNSQAQNGMSISCLTAEQGLRNNSVTAFCEDQYGFLWIGYDGGLDRYDGKELVHFSIDPFNPGSLSNPLIRSLLVDSKNRLWIGTQGGLFRYDYSNLSFIEIDIEIATPQPVWIEAMEETIENGEPVLWLSLFQTGLVKYSPDNNKAILYRPDLANSCSISDSTILDIHFDGEHIWLGTLSGGLDRFDPETEETKNFKKDPSDKYSINDNHVLQILSDTIDNHHILWIGTGKGGLNRFDLQTERFDDYGTYYDDLQTLKNVRLFSLQKFQNKLLIGTAGRGLIVFDPVAESLDFSPVRQVKENFSSSYIRVLYLSRTGIIWIGSMENGACYYDPLSNSFSSVYHDSKDENSLSAKSVNGFAEISPGKIMVATNTGIDLFIRDENLVVRHNNIPEWKDVIPQTLINSICKSRFDEDIIWIGTFNEGLIKYDLSANSVKRYFHDPKDKHTISNNTITIIVEAADGYLWCAGSGNGVNRINPATGKITRFYHEKDNNNSLSDNYVLSIFEDSDSTIWISTYNGLSKYLKGKSEFHRITFDEGKNIPTANLVGSVAQDPNASNILWVSTAGGLIKLDKLTEKFSRFTIQNGLPTNLILGAIPDQENHLWLSSTAGISKFNTRNGFIENYTIEDGIQGLEHNFNAFYCDSDGYIYFGGTNGLTFFKPEDHIVPPVRAEVVLSDFYLSNEIIDVLPETFLDSSLFVKKKVTLSWSDNAFGIGFVFPDFGGPSNIIFEYMLEGFDTDWMSTSKNSRSASFTNIPPGEYEFRVRAQNADNLAKSEFASLRIRILRPFWKKWWAYSLYVLILAGSIISYIRIKIYNTEKEKAYLETLVHERTEELALLNKNKDRFFSIVAHDIKSPLISLLRFTEIVMKRYNKLSEEERLSSITEINKSLNSSYKYLTNLLDWSRIQIGRFEYNPRQINLKKIIDQQINYLHINASGKDVQLISEIGNSIFVHADYEMISIVFSNLLSNGIKFSKRGGKVTIRSYIEQEQIFIVIEDNGIGMDPEQVKNLFHIDKISRTRGTENEDGTGLGLILCKDLMEKNYGDLHVESASGAGSRFVVSLPSAN
ncbi:MAG: hypothetical protein KAH17_01455 [Bacteroidales bacterium]|nr:hypothetical protein [Bacteroidales bacterium]